jgi:hypothetical protein
MRVSHFILGTAIGLAIACGVSDESRIPALAPGCTIQSATLQTRSGLHVEFIPPPSGVPLNELFSLEAVITNFQSPEALSILVDATMPAHGHGMLTRVAIEPLDTVGHFRIDQMNLHMPGEWELSALLMDGDNAEQVRSLVICAEG